LKRYSRGADLAIGSKPVVVDRTDVPAHERPRLHRIARMLTESRATARLASPFVVFVPREGAAENIGAGSGILGTPRPGAELVLVYYEGAVRGQRQMARLADRVFHAYDRLVRRYPTVARMTLPLASLVEVGTFDPSSGTIAPTDSTAEATLATWLGSEVLDPAELRRSESAN